jgi:hypothetical protein
MAQIIQLRRGTASEWSAANPILAEGEMGVVTDQPDGAFKVGNGNQTWNDLPFVSGEVGPEGDRGQRGAVWHTGTTTPAAGLGVVGDFYLRTGATNPGDTYEKINASTWIPRGSIRGAQGNVGPVGPPGAGGGLVWADWSREWYKTMPNADHESLLHINDDDAYLVGDPQFRLAEDDMVLIDGTALVRWHPQEGSDWTEMYVEPVIQRVSDYSSWSGRGHSIYAGSSYVGLVPTQDDEGYLLWVPFHGSIMCYWDTVGMFRSGIYMYLSNSYNFIQLISLSVRIWRGTTQASLT